MIPEKSETSKVSLQAPHLLPEVAIGRIRAENSGFIELLRQESKWGKPRQLEFAGQTIREEGATQRKGSPCISGWILR